MGSSNQSKRHDRSDQTAAEEADPGCVSERVLSKDVREHRERPFERHESEQHRNDQAWGSFRPMDRGEQHHRINDIENVVNCGKPDDTAQHTDCVKRSAGDGVDEGDPEPGDCAENQPQPDAFMQSMMIRRRGPRLELENIHRHLAV
jgi:hypothetical protein